MHKVRLVVMQEGRRETVVSGYGRDYQPMKQLHSALHIWSGYKARGYGGGVYILQQEQLYAHNSLAIFCNNDDLAKLKKLV